MFSPLFDTAKKKRQKYTMHTNLNTANTINTNNYCPSSSSDGDGVGGSGCSDNYDVEESGISDVTENVDDGLMEGGNNLLLNEKEEKELSSIEGGEYFLPSNSDKEIERLQMQHFLLRLFWQGNYSSPIIDDFINGGVKVLDVQ